LTDPNILFQNGLALHQSGDVAGAEELYQRVLTLMPKHFDALHLSGVIAHQKGDASAAVRLISEAIALGPFNSAFAPAYSNRASAYKALGRPDLAMQDFDRALMLGLHTADVHFNRANTFFDQHDFASAAEGYAMAIQLSPDDARIHNSLGIALSQLNRNDEAIAAFQAAIRLRPDHAAAMNNLGMLFLRSGQRDAAMDAFAAAIKQVPAYADPYNNRAGMLFDAGRYQDAVADYDRLLKLRPGALFAAGLRLHAKMFVCDWADVEAETAALVAGVEAGKPVTPSMPLLALTDSLAAQRKAAEIWTKLRAPFDPALGPVPAYPKHGRIRIGYFSADYHSHATAYVLTEFFECHDRSRFETVAFSFGPDKKDAERHRLMGAFDRFEDVARKSDREIAALSRDMEIDIAVDLKGYTTGSRPGILACRAAPVQVNYMGYPGPLGNDYLDYIVGDATVIPPADYAYYTEKVVTLPHSYYVNDSNRPLSDKTFTRAELGLPETGFVFCCFNNNFKITPAVFSSWMRILARVPDSVLWLFEDNAAAAAYLRKAAKEHGIDAKRLVFAKRVLPGDHLARQRAADLLLDTLPYNAHTTGTDALWVGLPLLTRPGASFAARVAASLLRAVDMPELIVTTAEAYEAMAVDLATDPKRFAQIKEKLARNRLTTPLFNTALFTRHMEAAYTQMYERHHAGLAPDHLVVQTL